MIEHELKRAAHQDQIDAAPEPITIGDNAEFLTMENDKQPAHRPRKLLTTENLAHWLRRNTSAQKRKTAGEIAEYFKVTPTYMTAQLLKCVNDPRLKVNRVIFGNKYQYYGYTKKTPSHMVESNHK